MYNHRKKAGTRLTLQRMTRETPRHILTLSVNNAGKEYLRQDKETTPGGYMHARNKKSVGTRNR